MTLLEKIQITDEITPKQISEYEVYRSKTKLEPSLVEKKHRQVIDQLSEKPYHLEHISSENIISCQFEPDPKICDKLQDGLTEALVSFTKYLDFEDYLKYLSSSKDIAKFPIYVPSSAQDVKRCLDLPIVNIVYEISSKYEHTFRANYRKKKPILQILQDKTNKQETTFIRHFPQSDNLENTIPEFIVLVAYRKGLEADTIMGAMQELFRMYIVTECCIPLLREMEAGYRGSKTKIKQDEQRSKLRYIAWKNVHSLIYGLVLDWAYTEKNFLGFSLRYLDTQYLKFLNSNNFFDRQATAIMYSTKHESPKILTQRCINTINEFLSHQ